MSAETLLTAPDDSLDADVRALITRYELMEQDRDHWRRLAEAYRADLRRIAQQAQAYADDEGCE